MITIPKPNFSETNVPIGISKDDYEADLFHKQGHVLNDAIDRVSVRIFYGGRRFLLKISSNIRKLKYEIFQIYDDLLLDSKSLLYHEVSSGFIRALINQRIIT